MQVTVAFAPVAGLFVRSVAVATGATVADAIAASGLLAAYPSLDLERTKVGIFARKVALTTTLKEGDRIEIYRPLSIDPLEARHARVAARRKRRS